MRIHGDKNIHRRLDIPYMEDYHDYIPYLREDFYNICGYCGKHEMISHRGMEPDHFVPDRIDHSRQCDYSNLVYSCFTCNRKKQGKWPTSDKDKSHDENEGFVDPATSEYDMHLGRAENGEIEYYTSVGEYMFNTFRFGSRPIKIIWKASLLYELTEELKTKVNEMSDVNKEKYLSMYIELSKFQQYLFNNNE